MSIELPPPRRLIFDFEKDFKPRLSYEYFIDEERKKKATVSVLSSLAECAYKREGNRAFKAMLKLTSDVEVSALPLMFLKSKSIQSSYQSDV